MLSLNESGHPKNTIPKPKEVAPLERPPISGAHRARDLIGEPPRDDNVRRDRRLFSVFTLVSTETDYMASKGLRKWRSDWIATFFGRKYCDGGRCGASSFVRLRRCNVDDAIFVVADTVGPQNVGLRELFHWKDLRGEVWRGIYMELWFTKTCQMYGSTRIVVSTLRSQRSVIISLLETKQRGKKWSWGLCAASHVVPRGISWPQISVWTFLLENCLSGADFFIVDSQIPKK